METKHTPGPWQTLPEEADKAYIRVRGTRLGSRYKVANVVTLDYAGVHPREAEETRANARLIAAAPELLEACETLLFELVAGPACRSEVIVFARAVIAKATTEAP
jgi:hypothetical protein